MVPLLASSALGLSLAAQDVAASPSTGVTYTLRVFDDLIQVPTLVLSRDFEVRSTLGPKNFTLRIDKGRSFHPQTVRREEDDPITLALFLDAHGKPKQGLSAGLLNYRQASDPFKENDQISIFASDCGFVGTAGFVPASLSILHLLAGNLLRAPNLHEGTSEDQSCREGQPVLSRINAALARLAERPGRRVLVVLSDGEDDDLGSGWTSLRDHANANSISVFALRPSTVKKHWEPRKYSSYAGVLLAPEDPLSDLCRSSGGLLLSTSKENVGAELSRIILWLRARYIIEFPRPANGVPGTHALDITTLNPRDLIRASGVVFPARGSDHPQIVPVFPSPGQSRRKSVDGSALTYQRATAPQLSGDGS
ncbi:MAG: hypothetical protein ACRYGF_06325 [Janthinobacterium lividum]